MASNTNKARSKTKKSKCAYCGEEMLDQNLKAHCEEVHNKPKLVHGETQITPSFFGKKRKSSDVQTQGVELGIDEDSQVEKKDDNGENEKLDEILLRVKDIQISIKTREELSKANTTDTEKAQQNVNEKKDKRLDHLKMCCSVQEVSNLIAEFTYKSSDGYFVCEVCCPRVNFNTDARLHNQSGIFHYDPDNGLSFTSTEKISPAFSNLKRNLKDHLTSKSHMSHCEKDIIDEGNAVRRGSKNHEIGMRIARLCYSAYNEGKSERSFEIEMLKRIQDGQDIGDINHSHNFPGKFRPFVAAEIHRQMSLYFQTRMIQTGFLPPVNIGADKGTSHHRTRQFIMAVTIIPDADKLIQPVYMGQPVVKHHDGKGVASSIKDGLDTFGIKGVQLEVSSHDGQYTHLSVLTYLRKLYDLNDIFFSTTDPLHLAGTTDVHMRKDPTFEWMVKLFSTCKELYNKFNWGKNYELLVETCDIMEKSMASLVNFQLTRFANSIRFVVINIRLDYEAIVAALEKLHDLNKHSSDSKDQEHSRDAQRILNQIRNKQFCLHLSGLSDVYDLFGIFVNEVQKVNVLPHERYDNALKVLDRMKDMKPHIDHDDCVEK